MFRISFDELYAGNARIDTDVLLGVIEDIKRNEDESLVIASNMLQGKPEVEPRAMRTSILPELTNGVDMREYTNQITFVNVKSKELIGRSNLRGEPQHGFRSGQ